MKNFSIKYLQAHYRELADYLQMAGTSSREMTPKEEALHIGLIASENIAPISAQYHKGHTYHGYMYKYEDIFVVNLPPIKLEDVKEVRRNLMKKEAVMDTAPC